MGCCVSKTDEKQKLIQNIDNYKNFIRLEYLSYNESFLEMIIFGLTHNGITIDDFMECLASSDESINFRKLLNDVREYNGSNIQSSMPLTIKKSSKYKNKRKKTSYSINPLYIDYMNIISDMDFDIQLTFIMFLFHIDFNKYVSLLESIPDNVSFESILHIDESKHLLDDIIVNGYRLKLKNNDNIHYYKEIAVLFTLCQTEVKHMQIQKRNQALIDSFISDKINNNPSKKCDGCNDCLSNKPSTPLTNYLDLYDDSSDDSSDHN